MSLHGNLSDFAAIEVLQLLATQEKTGMLRLHRGAKRVTLVFSKGEIVSIWDRSFSLVDPMRSYFMRKQVLPQHQMLRAVRMEAKTDMPFSEILLREGYLDPPELARLVKEQILTEIHEILAWDQGRFEFSPESKVQRYTPGCSIKVESLLLEAAKQYDERTYESSGKEDSGAQATPRNVPVSLSRPLKQKLIHSLVLLLIPTLTMLLSHTMIPPAGGPAPPPLLGIRVAEVSVERQIRNLRLLLEMYKALNNRYPSSLQDLLSVGLLSQNQLFELQGRDISYRALRGGKRYFLHSKKHGPLVHLIPPEHPIPARLSDPHVRSAAPK